MNDKLLPMTESALGCTATVADYDQLIQELQIIRDDKATAQGMMKTGTMTTVCSTPKKEAVGNLCVAV